MREKCAKWTNTINQKQKRSTYRVQFQSNHDDHADGYGDGYGYGKERVNDQFQRQ